MQVTQANAHQPIPAPGQQMHTFMQHVQGPQGQAGPGLLPMPFPFPNQSVDQVSANQYPSFAAQMPQNMPLSLGGGAVNRMPNHQGLPQAGASYMASPHYTGGYKSSPPPNGSPSPLSGLGQPGMPMVSGAPPQWLIFPQSPQTTNAGNFMPAYGLDMTSGYQPQQHLGPRGRGYGGRRQ
jgi:hypothetical protein